MYGETSSTGKNSFNVRGNDMSDQQLIKTFGPSSNSMAKSIDEWIEREKPIIESVNVAGGGDKYNPPFLTRILYRKRIVQQ